MKRAGSLRVRKVLAALFFFATFTINPQAEAALYTFTSHTFTNCTATGNTGPTQTQCRTAYSTTWDETDSNFMVANGIQVWKVPVSGSYQIKANGAAGGGSGAIGLGASIQGDFDLTQGETLSILVGQLGISVSNNGSGGGGGSFVIRGANTPLVIAGGGGSTGGGGGEAGSVRTARACGDASITTSAKPGCNYVNQPGDVQGVAGVNGGAGGATSSSWNGYPGAGFLSDASVGGAKSWSNYSLGGNLTTYGLGGFGGGGSGGLYGGSGGGGYSGGGANARHAHGGGGSSFNSGGNKVETLTAVSGNGSVVITFLAIATSDTTTTLTLPSSFTYRISSNIIATVSAAGRVTFFANGKRIAGCVSVPTVSSVSITATCSYKPNIRGEIQISASLVPADTSAYRSSTAGAVRGTSASRTNLR